MLTMSFVLCCLVSIYEWLICVKIIKYIHPISCARFLLLSFERVLLSTASPPRYRGRCWVAIRLSHRPEPSGRVVRGGFDGLDSGGRHGRRFVLLRHTHRPQRRPYPICTGRSGNGRHRCGGGWAGPRLFLGRSFRGVCVPVSGIEVRSLVRLSANSAFHW